MNLLKETFEKLKKENKKIKGVYLVSNYPDDDTFLELMKTSVDEGADFLEIAMPFSDPSADSHSVKLASAYALEKGVTIKKTIDLIEEFRKINKKTPIVWVGYFNSIYNYGEENFFKDIKKAAVDGILIHDLPVEEYDRILSAKKQNIDVIRIITSSTDEKRLDEILHDAKGFISFLETISCTKEQKENFFKYVKSKTNLPVISDKEDEFLDGTIKSSILIDAITENLDKDKSILFKEIKRLIK